jgi:hypothetical protein
MNTASQPIIVKVSTTGDGLALVCDKENKIVIEQAINQRTSDAMKGDAHAFFTATLGHGAWVIGKRVPEQFW